jgi:hypothetical protein
MGQRKRVRPIAGSRVDQSKCSGSADRQAKAGASGAPLGSAPPAPPGVVRPAGSGLAESDLEAMRDLPAEAFDPGEGGLLDDGFGEGVAHTLIAGRTAVLSLRSPSTVHR